MGASVRLDWLVLIFYGRKILLVGWFRLAETNQRTGCSTLKLKRNFKRLEDAAGQSSGRCVAVQLKCRSRQLATRQLLPSGAQTEQIMLTGHPAFGVTKLWEWWDNASTAKGWIIKSSGK